MSYSKDSRIFQLNEQIIAQESSLQHMMQEAQFMLTCLESGVVREDMRPDDIALEAGVVKKVGSGVVSLFKRIIEFLKGILKKFAEKTGIIAKSNEKWIDENKETLAQVKEHGMEVQMTPYWKNINKLTDVTNIIASASYSRIAEGVIKDNEAAKYGTVEDIKNKFFTRYLDSNKKLGEGIKNITRTGSPTKEEAKITVSGEELSKLIDNIFIPYVKSYKTSVLPNIQKNVSAITKMAESAERLLEEKRINSGNNEITKESFCVIENALYTNTELSNLIEVPVSEAISRVESQKNINDANKKNPESPAKVTVIRHGDEDQQQQASRLREASTERVQAAKNALSVAQTILTTTMTMYEEINIAYMNALKSSVDEILEKKKKSEKKTIDDAKNTVKSNDI